MQAPLGPHEPIADHPVWKKLSHYLVGPDDALLPFVARLACENGWSRAHAERVFEEYRRFCFLAATCGHVVTPSDAVDQAWHLHLTYTRDYWERFCPQVLGRPLHHGPTAGGPGEQHRFFLHYAETLRSYERVFGPPPADLWPDAARRLTEDHKARRVHPRDAFIVPRRHAAIGALLLGLALAAGWMGALLPGSG
ncbi:hypothetical protein [uncultured Sphingomonas sp.]|uniref:glycine-rich domain-containing protein n=1 Tax=uncultured Sphingomonas sp. TaxID=158754 RepID=UPI0025F41DE6|nr:hypothetical protein [uncultured Sphingomonas sp.]